MKQKIWSRYILFFFSTMGFLLFSIIVSFLSFDYIEDTQSSYTEPLIVNQISQELPKNSIKKTNEIRLEIPSISVDASVKSVGLTKEGIMDSPNNAYDVWLFLLGKRPGESGSAVIAGHYGVWKNGSVSVFNKLDRLKKWDKIHIGDGKWWSISFVVRESKIYDLEADALEVFVSNDGKAYLNLITCVLDKQTKKYSKRLVVFTEKI